MFFHVMGVIFCIVLAIGGLVGGVVLWEWLGDLARDRRNLQAKVEGLRLDLEWEKDRYKNAQAEIAELNARLKGAPYR